MLYYYLPTYALCISLLGDNLSIRTGTITIPANGTYTDNLLGVNCLFYIGDYAHGKIACYMTRYNSIELIKSISSFEDFFSIEAVNAGSYIGITNKTDDNQQIKYIRIG